MMMALGTGGGFTKWRGIRDRKGFVFGFSWKQEAEGARGKGGLQTEPSPALWGAWHADWSWCAVVGGHIWALLLLEAADAQAGKDCSEDKGTWQIGDIFLQDRSTVDLTWPFSLDTLITVPFHTMKVNMLLSSISSFQSFRSLSQYHLFAVCSRKNKGGEKKTLVERWFWVDGQEICWVLKDLVHGIDQRSAACGEKKKKRAETVIM